MNLRKIDFGIGKILIRRSREDVSIVQAAIIFYLGYKAGLDDWYWLLLIPLYVVYKYFDVKKFHRQETDYAYTKNTRAMEMHKWLKEMYEASGKY